jgi:alpha-tubulin suppressor-like RCC1 family protein
MGIQNSEPGQSGYAKSFETSSTRRRAVRLAALAFTGVSAGGCSSSTPANGNDAGYVAPPNGTDDGSTSTDDGNTTTPTDDGSTTTPTDDGSTTTPTGDGSTAGIGDGSTSTTGDVGATTMVGYDGGIGPTCIKALYSTYILRTDGVLIWENNASSPETILDASTGNPLTGILNVQEGQYHGCAAVSTGTAECWQTNAASGNTSGQLGNGTTTATSVLYRATPVLTAPSTPLTNVVAVAPGNTANNATYRSACAVTSDGKLWCWGDLTWLVKDGTTNLRTGYAQAITTDGSTPFTGVSSAVLGSAEACAIVTASSTNSVWCWGYNGHGELGQGDTTTRQYPTKVLGLTNPSKVVTSWSNGAGDTFCALDGSSVRCWGSNSNGQAGTNTTTDPVPGPTQVVVQSGAVLGNIVDIQGGAATFAALLTSNTMWNWGYGFQIYATNYSLTNVLAIGWSGPSNYNGPRYITSDGVYHNAMANVTVNCNAM